MNADLLIHNAHVFTGDATHATAEAVAVRGGEIVYVGCSGVAQQWRGANTRLVDANGRSLLPGFIDTHFHLMWGSETLLGAQLHDVTTLDELTTAVRAWMAANPDAPWVLGYGLSYELPSASEPLTRQHLDQIVADKPLALTAFDLHSLFVNSAALQAAGMARGANVAVGAVTLDADGHATGELYEMEAMALVQRKQPRLTDTDWLALIRCGMAHAAAHGITSVHNMDGDWQQAQLYGRLEESSELIVRIDIPYWVKPGTSIETMLAEAEAMRRFRSPMLRSSRVKFFMDGVYESYTAVSVNGYPDRPGFVAEPIWDAETFAAYATAADAAGLQIATHAVGDGAVRRVLDGYARAQVVNGRLSHRHRIEHIELIQPEDVPRFAELGVIAAMQPLHAPLAAADGGIWPTRIDPAEWSHAFPWRTLRQAGATLVFGSDWPVVTLDPLLAIHGAVNRQPLAAGDRDQRQTVAEAILSYTRHAAYAEFQEPFKGQIAVGMAADLVLLSDDIFAVPPSTIRDLDVVLTVCNGRVTFEKEEVDSNK